MNDVGFLIRESVTIGSYIYDYYGCKRRKMAEIVFKANHIGDGPGRIRTGGLRLVRATS